MFLGVSCSASEPASDTASEPASDTASEPASDTALSIEEQLQLQEIADKKFEELLQALSIEEQLQEMADRTFQELQSDPDLSPDSNRCDAHYGSAKEISLKDFVVGLQALVREVHHRDTYDYVTLGGERIRSGPKTLWMQQAFEDYLNDYKPPHRFDDTQFNVDDIRVDNVFSWRNYLRWRNAVCLVSLDDGPVRDSMVEHGRFSGWRTEWPGHAMKWQPYPYVDTGQQVVAAPAIRGLEHYTKYIAGGGVVITGGDDVPDAAMLQARKEVVYETSARPEYREILEENTVRISLFYGEDTSMLPEFHDIYEPGGFSTGPLDAAMTANAQWLCFPGHIDRGGHPIFHEMVHTINHVVFEQLNDTYFYERIYQLAERAVESGVFKPGEQYLGSEDVAGKREWIGEYWATTVEGYLMDRAGFKNSHDTRDWIQANDPDLYDLIIRYFPTEPWDHCPEVPPDWREN